MNQADSFRYNAYVAGLYDTYVNTTFDVPFFLNEAKGVSGEVLELMAGTGRVSIPLIKAGVRLTCVDRSSAMLTILEEKLERLKKLDSAFYEIAFSADVEELRRRKNAVAVG